MKKKVILRADGGSNIGMGHFTRTLALGEMLKKDFYCIFATRKPTQYQKQEIARICKGLIELPEDITHFYEFLKVLKGDEIVVLDNYFFDTYYQKRIKDKGCNLVCIDDIHDKHYVADIVINHAPGIIRNEFSIEDYTKLLLGPKYALIREVFLESNTIRRNYKEAHESILLVFGGSDLNNLTCEYLHKVYYLNNFKQINIITGDGYRYINVLESLVGKLKKSKINHYHNIKAEELIQVILQSDIVIAPASTILYEILNLKTPVISGYCVDNQKYIYQGFKDLNIILDGGDLNSTDGIMDLLKNIDLNNYLIPLKKLDNLFDGLSGKRIKNELLKV
ncbi:UDP-2,4-diacetamido-2,4,6-trideoxy-beta-L-altropyranose hydrolase [Bacteroidota bacterium]